MKRMSLLFVSLLMLATVSFAQQFTWNPLDVGCDPAADPATCPAGLTPGTTAASTIASGINPAGDIVGTYTDAAGKNHGFLLKDGAYNTVDVPGWLIGLPDEGVTLPTSATGISPHGDIVGNFIAPVNATAAQDSAAYCPSAGSPACSKGFLYRHGQFSTLLVAGHPGAVAQRIAPDGDIYGCVHDLDLMGSMVGAAWFRFGAAGTSTLSSVPMSMMNGATPGGGMVIGLFNTKLITDGFGPRHGFVIRDGEFQQYDVERAGQPASSLTAIWDISPSKAFVGTYVIAGKRHGFLQLPDGTEPPAPLPWASSSAIDIDYPGAAATIAYGINPDGVIVGQYNNLRVVDGRILLGLPHGFVAFPVSN